MESLGEVDQNVLPPETRKIARQYSTDRAASEVINDTLTRLRQENAKAQREYLDNLPIVTAEEALGPYHDMSMSLLQDQEIPNSQESDPINDQLKAAFPPEEKYRIGSQKVKGKTTYIVVKKGENGLSDLIIALGSAKSYTDALQFDLEKLTFLDTTKTRAFGLIESIQACRYSTYFFIMKDSHIWGGSENLSGKHLEIHIGKNGGREKIPYVGFHELGHTFQEPNFFNKVPLLDFLEIWSKPLKFLFPHMGNHMLDGLRREKDYQEAVGKNLQERNADAFAVALYRKLRDYGINILPNNKIREELNYRKVERVKSESYKPE